jgi:nicotinamide-nucleotide amidase
LSAKAWRFFPANVFAAKYINMNQELEEFCVERALIEEARPVVERLCASRLSVVTAESCTAGLIAAVLTHIPGAGDCFQGAFVAYSKKQKVTALGLDETLLREKGSVNPETAEQMGMGALKNSPATLALAVTGVLGPDPDEDGNPAGLVYVAICREHVAATVKKFNFQGSPHSVRRQAIREALFMLGEAAADTGSGSSQSAARVTDGAK